MLKDNADKLGGDDKSRIEGAVNEVKEALKGGDATAIKAASEKLNEAWQSVSETLYKAASEKNRAEKGPEEAGKPPGGEDKEPGKEEGPIIDAEVVDEKKS